MVTQRLADAESTGVRQITEDNSRRCQLIRG